VNEHKELRKVLFAKIEQILPCPFLSKQDSVKFNIFWVLRWWIPGSHCRVGIHRGHPDVSRRPWQGELSFMETLGNLKRT